MAKKQKVMLPQLIFTAHGAVELHINKECVWQSDADEQFAEENQNEFLNPDTDEEMILNYLIDQGILEEDEELEVVEESLSESDDEQLDDEED